MYATAEFTSFVKPWGNGLGVRLTKPLAFAAGVSADTPVRITAEQNRIVIDIAPKRPSLSQMLASFDPAKHGGEAMAFSPVGREVL